MSGVNDSNSIFMIDREHPFNVTPFTENFSDIPCDIVPFQTEINKLFGFEPITNRPWLRIVWMPSNRLDDAGLPETLDWNDYGDGGRGNWRRRHLYSAEVNYVDTFDPESNIWYSKEVWTDIAPPRFCLERFISPEYACAGWVASGIDHQGDRFTTRKPDKGLYEALFLRKNISPILAGGMFAIHDGVCCATAKREEVNCYGFYTPPRREHLDELKKLAWLQRQAPERRPGYSTAEEMEIARKTSADLKEKYLNKLGDNIYGAAFEAARTHRGMLSDDPSKQYNGIYHFMGAHSKSGLTKDEHSRITGKKIIHESSNDAS